MKRKTASSVAAKRKLRYREKKKAQLDLDLKVDAKATSSIGGLGYDGEVISKSPAPKSEGNSDRPRVGIRDQCSTRGKNHELPESSQTLAHPVLLDDGDDENHHGGTTSLPPMIQNTIPLDQNNKSGQPKLAKREKCNLKRKLLSKGAVDGEVDVKRSVSSNRTPHGEINLKSFVACDNADNKMSLNTKGCHTNCPMTKVCPSQNTLLESYFTYQATQGLKQLPGDRLKESDFIDKSGSPSFGKVSAISHTKNRLKAVKKMESVRQSAKSRTKTRLKAVSKRKYVRQAPYKHQTDLKPLSLTSQSSVEGGMGVISKEVSNFQFSTNTALAITSLKETNEKAKVLKEERLISKKKGKTSHALSPEKLAERRERAKLRKRKSRLSGRNREVEENRRLCRLKSHKTQMEILISRFHVKTKSGPTFICLSCKRLLYKHSVRNAEKLKKSNTVMSRKCLRGSETFLGKSWVCETCHKHISKGKVPPMSRANGCKFPKKPSWMKLNDLEWRLLAPRLVFMKIHQAPRGRQYKIEGNVVNVVADVSNTVTSLPRLPSQNLAIPIKLKRRIRYHRHAYSQNVRPNLLWKVAKWLAKYSPLYEEMNMNLTPQWHKILKKMSIFKRARTYDRKLCPSKGSKSKLKVISERHGKRALKHRAIRNTKIFRNSLTRYKSLKKYAFAATKVDGKGKPMHSRINMKVPGKRNRRKRGGKGPRGSPGTLDTMLTADGFLEKSEKNKILSIAPGENQRPMSVFLDKDCEELAYPDIFLGSRRQEHRSVNINYSDVVKCELMNKDRRAAKNVENLFFKTKKLQMKIITGQTSIALRKHKPNQNSLKASNFKSGDALNNLLKTDQGYQFLKTVRGSPPYFETAKKDVFAMIRQLGPATFFLSLSAAETKWTHLLKNLGRIVDKREYSDDEIKKMKWDTTTRLIQSDPITCARHFEYQLQTFIKDFIKSKHAPLGELLDFFYRIEMQHRGSCHVHMIVWIKSAPSPSQSSHKAITKFIDKHITCALPKNPNEQELILRQRHHHTDTCKKNNSLCRFNYPQPPMHKTTILEPLGKDDPEYKTHKQNWDKIKHFLDSHSTSTYMTIKSFLKHMSLTDSEYISAVSTSIRSNTIFLKRKLSEIHINNYNVFTIKAWQANMDIQYILDTYACATYVVQYITKGTRGLSQLLKSAAKESKEKGSNIKEQMKHIGNKFLNSVEISAQEAAYLALQMPLKRSSRKCVFVNTSPPEDRIQLLKPINQIKQMEDDETDLSTSNMLKRYSERPDSLEDKCLADWVAFYDSTVPYIKVSKKLQSDGTPPEVEQLNFEKGVDDLPKKDKGQSLEDKRRKKARVLRCPWFNVKQDEEKHYREMIVLFLPWRSEEKDINQDKSSFKDQYIHNKDIITKRLDQYAPCRTAVEDAEAAIKDAIANGEIDPSNIAPLTVHMNAIDISNEQISNDPKFVQQYDIGEDMGVHLPNLPKYEDLKHNQLQDKDFRQAVQTLNKEQREFFDYINNVILVNGDQQLIFLSGGAGVGKSRLTKAIYQNLIRLYNYKEGEDYENLKVLVMAPTGKAAHLIQGVTIHSGLHAPFNSQSDQYIPLGCSLLNTLRTSLGHVEFIIIDEVSMVGTNRINFVNERMKEIKGSEEPFGGCHVLCVGDLFQLRPVADSMIFESSSSKKDSIVVLAPNVWTQHFKLVELTTIMRQKENKTFAQMLNRLREGKHTDEDVNFIKARQLSKDFRSLNYPHFKATHLFNTNDLVEEFNLIARRGVPIHFLANDSISHVSSEELGLKLLQIFQNRPTKETMGLPTKLSIAIDDRVEISTNIDIADGLTNGASGVVCMLPPAINETSTLPAIGTIWVLFDEASIGRHTRGLNDNLYSEEIDPMWTPIPTIKKQIKISKNSPITATRFQFPLRIAAAKTIHRSQGQTLLSAVADFKFARGPHKHYVALSRVTNSNNLFVTNFDENDINTSAKVIAEMERLRREPLQIQSAFSKNIGPKVTTYLFHNVRTAHKHSQDLSHDFNIKSTSVLCLAETHLRCNTTLKNLKEIFPFVYHNHPLHSQTQPCAKHGTSIFAKVELESVKHFNTSTLEATKAYDPVRCVHMLCVYRYPNSSIPKFLEDLSEIPLSQSDERKIVLGDFNINIHEKNQKTIENLSKGLRSHQLVNSYTTKYNTVIDHIYTNLKSYKAVGVLKTYYSDHDQIYLQI